MNRAIYSLSVFLLLLLTVSCSQSQNTGPQASVDETVVSSTPLFQTKEPERYRATRTLTMDSGDGEILVSKNWIARAGEMRRDEMEVGGLRVAYITLPEGKGFVLLPDEKLFADRGKADPEIDGAEDSESSPLRLLHTDPTAATYRRLGAETIGGRNTQKYRVIVNSSTNANVSVSETVIWVDEALQMPIRSETKSTNGARSTMELSEIILDADQTLFRVPEGYKEISFAELARRLKLD